MTQEDGNISRELIYREGKRYNTDNDRINDNKLLGIDMISRHGNEE